MEVEGKPTQRSGLMVLVKFSVAAVLFLFLLKKGFISWQATRDALREWPLILMAFSGMFFSTILSIVRWYYLLRAQRIYLKGAVIFKIAFIGNFFNLALPGAISGDFVKAIYAAKAIDGNRAYVFSSIFFDRVTGLSALILVSCGALLFARFNSIWYSGFSYELKLFIACLGLGVLLFYFCILILPERFDPFLRVFVWLKDKRRWFGSLWRFYCGIRQYNICRRTALGALGISILIHFLVVMSCVQFTWALGGDGPPPLSLFVIVPMGLLITAFPLTPGGVGTGHAAFIGLYHLFGSQRGADVFNLYLLYQMSMALVGGVIYLGYRKRHTKPIGAIIACSSSG